MKNDKWRFVVSSICHCSFVICYLTAPRLLCPSADLPEAEKVEVAALVRLRDMIQEQLAVASRIVRLGWFPSGAPAIQFLVRHLQVQLTRFDVQLDQVSVLDESQCSSHRSLRVDVEHDSPIGRAAHSRVRDP